MPPGCFYFRFDVLLKMNLPLSFLGIHKNPLSAKAWIPVSIRKFL